MPAITRSKRKSTLSPRRSEESHDVMLWGTLWKEERAHSVHDNFNIITLPIICVMNFLCWDWSAFSFPDSVTSVQGVEGMWKGVIGNPAVDATRDPRWYYAFVAATVSYIVADLGFLIWLPNCVKSPKAIVSHHYATLLYIAVPIYHLPMRWFMGACMFVELNTWFMILRRVLNFKDASGLWKQISRFTNVPTPLGTVKLVSVCFWITWVIIRLAIYPALVPVAVKMWWSEVLLSSYPAPISWMQVVLLAPVFQIYLTYLNLQWTLQLVKNKLQNKAVAKGL